MNVFPVESFDLFANLLLCSCLYLVLLNKKGQLLLSFPGYIEYYMC